MDRKKHFEKYYSRLKWEGIIKSLLSGLIIGAATAFATAFVSWFIGAKIGWIIAIGVLVAVTAVSAIVFYFKKFRPTVKSNAKRIDRMGLDERLITMVELENDNSYIAQRQREDARQRLEKVDVKSIKFRFARWLVVTASVVAAVSVGMTTISGLTSAGILKSGNQLWETVFPEEEVWYEVEFIIADGGRFEGGDEIQVVLAGESTVEIIAVPEDDRWVFDGWSDGYTNPTRIVSNVQSNMVLEAFFVQLPDAGGLGEGPGGQGMEGLGAPNGMPGQGQGKGEQSGDGPPSNGAGGKYETHNQVINGNTFSGDVLGDYMNNAMDQLTQNNDLSAGMRDFIESYFEIIYAEPTE